MSDTNLQPKKPLSDEYLTIREHLDMDKHWIGESLPVASVAEMATSISTVTATGDSPIPARADHTHKVNYIPEVISWNPNWGNLTKGTGFTEVAYAVEQRFVGTSLRMIYVNYYLAFGTGTVGPTSNADSTIGLPVTVSNRLSFIGIASASVRLVLQVFNITDSAASVLVRPITSKPTATETNRPVSASDNNLFNITPAVTWSSTSWLQFNGVYMTSA